MTAPPAVSTRAASTDELDLLEEFHGLAMAAIAPQRGGELAGLLRGRPDPVGESFDIELARADSLVLFGLIDDVPIGYAVVRVEHLSDDSKLARVTDLFVLEPARGVGVGEALLEAQLEFARERGCIGIDAFALPGDRTTKNFFESFGLVARSIEVYRTLD